jgi:hypothetical protein
MVIFVRKSARLRLIAHCQVGAGHSQGASLACDKDAVPGAPMVVYFLVSEAPHA